MKKAIYGFSGDPITWGHIDIIKRALAIFGELTVGIGNNPAKKYFFNLDERHQIAQESLKSLPNVTVVPFRGLLVDYAYENNISTVIRGIRNSEDLNYELMLHQVGESQKNKIDTIYFPARQELTHVSSGAAKALQLEQGLIHEFVPIYTKQRLEEKLSGQYIISVTGEIGAGKSFVSAQLQKLGAEHGIDTHVVDIDKIGHELLGKLEEPLYKSLRQEIAQVFGTTLLTETGFINRQVLGQIIFNASDKLELFNNTIYKPLLLRLRRELYGKRGLIILDTALIAESNMSYLSNNHVVLVRTNETTQKERLNNRGYSEEQIQSRLNSQFNTARKESMIEQQIADDMHGKLWQLDNSTDNAPKSIADLFAEVTTHLGLK